jgi:sterol desaturase/sphingolipid hydroxylase (fatty acid hydroxylase superfamily)
MQIHDVYSDMTDISLQKSIISFLILAVLFSTLEWWFGKNKKPIFRKGWKANLAWFFYSALVGKFLRLALIMVPLLALMLCGVASINSLQGRTYNGFGPIAAQPWWLQLIEIYVLTDFIGYWTHRLFHQRHLWPFHAVHHSSEDLNWLGSVRVHPVNEMMNQFVHVAPLLLVGFNPWIASSYAPFLTLYAIMLHAELDWDFGPFRYIIASPVFHRWHHSKQCEAWDKNFAGLFPLWDLLYGTLYMPKNRKPEDFGITDDMPESFLGQMVKPFIWQAGRKN